MFQWRKVGRIFNPTEVTDRPWLKEYAQAPATLVFDDFVRVYFSCRPEPDHQGMYVSHTAYVDLDRRDLTRIVNVASEPIMPLGDTGTFDEFGVYPVSVTRRDREVWAYYGGWTRCESIPFTVSVGLAISQDEGRSFRRVGPGPLLTCSVTDPYVVSGPKIRRFGDLWHLWYVAGTRWQKHDGRVEAVYKIRRATSTDGLNWYRDGFDAIPDIIDPDECQASPDVFYRDGRYHMFFCFKHGLNFRNAARGYRIGYAWSDDMIHWHRDDDLAGLTPSATGWDSETVAYPHVFELDGQVHMLYLGNQFGRYGFGLATLESWPDLPAKSAPPLSVASR